MVKDTFQVAFIKVYIECPSNRSLYGSAKLRPPHSAEENR
jgi:hypothetical protein